MTMRCKGIVIPGEGSADPFAGAPGDALTGELAGAPAACADGAPRASAATAHQANERRIERVEMES